MNQLIILRGIPGTGKSTLAQSIQKSLSLNQDNLILVVSADDYFVHHEKYEYDASKIHLAHRECQHKAFEFVNSSREYKSKTFNLIVDNTNLKFRDFKLYIELCNYCEWKISLFESFFMKDINKPDFVQDCFSRNKHGVPLDKISKMKDNWETNQSCYLKIKEMNLS